MNSEKTFLWASVHEPTKEQEESLGNCLMLKDTNPTLYNRLIKVEDFSQANFQRLAKELISTANSVNASVIVQPAGPPAFQAVLGGMMTTVAAKISLFYANSRRESSEIRLPDGSVKKVSTFRHIGWTELTF